jgi:hypothetical protein
MVQIIASVIIMTLVVLVARMAYISRKFRNPEKRIRATRRRLAAGRFM